MALSTKLANTINPALIPVGMNNPADIKDPLRVDQRTAVKAITDHMELFLDDPRSPFHNDLAYMAAVLEAAFPQFYSDDPKINKHVAGDRKRYNAMLAEKRQGA